MDNAALKLGFRSSVDEAGNRWVLIDHFLGVCGFTWGVPEDKADEFLEGFEKGVRGCFAVPKSGELVCEHGTPIGSGDCLGCTVVAASKIE